MNSNTGGMKRTARDNIKTVYSLHDMSVIAFEVSGNDAVMRTQSGMVKTTPPYGVEDDKIRFLLDMSYDLTKGRRK